MTINEFRNKHYGRGGSTATTSTMIHLLGRNTTHGGELGSTDVSKGYSFVRDGSDVTGQFINAN